MVASWNLLSVCANASQWVSFVWLKSATAKLHLLIFHDVLSLLKISVEVNESMLIHLYSFSLPPLLVLGIFRAFLRTSSGLQRFYVSRQVFYWSTCLQSRKHFLLTEHLRLMATKDGEGVSLRWIWICFVSYPWPGVRLSEISVNLTSNIMCDEPLSQFGADYMYWLWISDEREWWSKLRSLAPRICVLSD